ncbi:hypothetical protein BGX27_001886, partial [Mortierella sp. AM989]
GFKLLPFEKALLEFKEAPFYVNDKKSHVFTFQMTYDNESFIHKAIVTPPKSTAQKRDALQTWLWRYSTGSESEKAEMLGDTYEANGIYRHRAYKSQNGEIRETGGLSITSFNAIGSIKEAVLPGFQIRESAFIPMNQRANTAPPSSMDPVSSQPSSSQSSGKRPVRGCTLRVPQELSSDEDLDDDFDKPLTRRRKERTESESGSRLGSRAGSASGSASASVISKVSGIAVPPPPPSQEKRRVGRPSKKSRIEQSATEEGVEELE